MKDSERSIIKIFKTFKLKVYHIFASIRTLKEKIKKFSDWKKKVRNTILNLKIRNGCFYKFKNTDQIKNIFEWSIKKFCNRFFVRRFDLQI